MSVVVVVVVIIIIAGVHWTPLQLPPAQRVPVADARDVRGAEAGRDREFLNVSDIT